MSLYTDSYDSQVAAIAAALDASTTGRISYARVDKYSEAVLGDLASQEQITYTATNSTTWEVAALAGMWDAIDWMAENPEPEE